MLRSALLGAARNASLRRAAARHGMRLGARRYVAGETLGEFLAVAREVNARGARVAGGVLGEDVGDPEEARRAAREYESLLDAIAADGLNANVALKLTHLGLLIEPALAVDNLESVVERAARHRNFVRIDMEQSAVVDATLRAYRALRERGRDNLGVVLQSYLYRSEADLQSLLPLEPNVRIVKGAYLEARAVAFPSKRGVDANFVRLLEISLLRSRFTALATHDRRIIEHAIEFIARQKVSRDRYEFQMLYGVRPALQSELMQRGFPLRVAVPFGSSWYPYLMRRLAERPANLWFFLGSLWQK